MEEFVLSWFDLSFLYLLFCFDGMMMMKGEIVKMAGEIWPRGDCQFDT